MTAGADVWDARGDAYRTSDAHVGGEDLDRLVAWSGGAATALDVGTGGGHVARRLREAGLEVVTCDPSPGMRPDVLCRAEDLPFADGSFDLVVCRAAAHHFAVLPAAMAAMARVARSHVLLVDTTDMGEAVEQAELLRDPTHVRNRDEAEWRELFAGVGLAVEELRFYDHAFSLDAWLRRTGCEGADAVRAVELLGDRVANGRLTLRRIAIRGAK